MEESETTVSLSAVDEHSPPSSRRLAIIAQNASWRIWGICRLYHTSLDSERYSGAIRAIVDDAIKEIRTWGRRQAAKAAEWRARYLAAKRELEECRRQLATLREQIGTRRAPSNTTSRPLSERIKKGNPNEATSTAAASEPIAHPTAGRDGPAVPPM